MDMFGDEMNDKALAPTADQFSLWTFVDDIDIISSGSGIAHIFIYLFCFVYGLILFNFDC